MQHVDAHTYVYTDNTYMYTYTNPDIARDPNPIYDIRVRLYNSITPESHKLACLRVRYQARTVF